MTSTPSLSQYNVLIFDVYATLVDWETGIYTALQPLIAKAGLTWSKSEALMAFNSVEKDLEVQHPEMLYSDLLAEIHRTFTARLGVEPDKTVDRQFGTSIARWPVFPDTVDALAKLKKYYKMVVLSNVDNISFHNYTRPQLEPNPENPIFDIVITAEDIKSYKPNPENFIYALKMIKEKFGYDKEQVLVTAASLHHDHKPANGLGIASSYIAREGNVTGIDSDATWTFKFATLGEMAKARVAEEVLI